MKKLFKGAIPTISLLLVAILTLTSVTYAWFTAGNEATVDTIDVNVKSVDGLLVSSNGYNGNWGSSLTPVFGDGIKGAKLTNVSSAGGLDDDGNLKFFSTEYSNVYDAFKSISAVSSEAGNYMKFTMYVKNEGGEGITISLDGSKVTGSALSRAITRIAFVNMGTAKANAAINNETSPSVTGTKSLIGIWEPNSKEHTSDGQAWLSKNGVDDDDLGKTQSYMALKGAYTVAKDDSEEKYLNVATGDEYKIINTLISLEKLEADDTTYDKNDVPSPTGAKYYVYSATTANHFAELAIKDFFKVKNPGEIVSLQADLNTMKAGITEPTTVDKPDTKKPDSDPGTGADHDLYVAWTKYEAYLQEVVDYLKGTTVAVENTAAVETLITESKLAAKITTAKTEKQKAYDDKLAADWNFYTANADSTEFTKIAITAEITINTTYYQLATVGYSAKSTDDKENTADVKAYTKAATEDYVKKLDGSDTTGTTYDNEANFKFTIDANTIEKIDVYIWLEGQDCDCTNYVAGNPFKVDLKLKKVTDTPAS